MSSAFRGFDHIDCRVRSLAAVEPFYDVLLPELGLSVKRYSYVDEAGDWQARRDAAGANTVEYFSKGEPGQASFFIGFIEVPDHTVTLTRIAFRIDADRFDDLEALLRRAGALHVERSADMEAYPAIFFEDPAGTKLELVARRPAG